MSKGIRSFPEERQSAVAIRRANSDSHGLGYWGALDYHDRKQLKYPGKAGMVQAIKEVQDHAIINERNYHQPDRRASRKQGAEDREVRPRRDRNGYQRGSRRNRGGAAGQPATFKLGSFWPKQPGYAHRGRVPAKG